MDNQIDDIITGIVSDIKSYGIFIKLNNTYGFCHISNVSKKFIKNLNDLFEIEQEVKVKIIGIDKDSNKINLSIKDAIIDDTLTSSKTYQYHSKSKININTNKNNQSFDKMLNDYLNQSNDKINNINKRIKKHQKR